MSEATRALRFHLYPRGDDGSGTPSLTFTHAHLLSVPDVGGRRVDLRAGKVHSMPYRLDLGEQGNELLTGILGDVDARVTLLGRLVRAQLQEDGGAWTDLDLGPVSNAGEDRPGHWSVEVSDMNWLGRRSQIFTLTKNVQLHPFGPTAAFGPSEWRAAAAGRDSGLGVLVVDGNALLLETTAASPLPRELADALLGDVVDAEDISISNDNALGNFRTLRAEITAVDGTPIATESLRVLQLGGETLNRPNVVRHVMGGAWPQDDRDMRIVQFWVHWSGHGLTAGQVVTGRLHFPTGGLRTSDELPVHIGGTEGIQVGDLLLSVLDGDFGGKAVPIDPAARTAIEALDLPRVWVRANAPVERDAWLAENIYPWFLILPLTGRAGLAPKQLWTPQGLDPDTLPTLSTSNVVGLERWEIVGRDVVNRIVGKFTRMIRDPEDGPLFDRLKADTFEASLDHDNVDDPVTGEHSLSTSLVFPATNERGVLRWIGGELFDLLGDGPTWRRLTAENITLGLQPGDIVKLDAASLKVPNASSNDRTGIRICRVMEARWGVASTGLVLLDFGPALQPLASPTVSIAPSLDDADLVDVTISNVPTGATVTVEVGWNSTDTEPAEWLLRDAGLGAGTHSFRLEQSGGFAWARAKSVKSGRIRSAWATASVALDTRPLILDLRLIFRGGTPVVLAEVNDGTLGLRVRYAVHDARTEPDELGEVEDFPVGALDDGLHLTGLAGPGQRVTASVEPWTGFSGGAVTGTQGPARSVSTEFVEETTPDDGIEWVGHHNHTETPARIGASPGARTATVRGKADPNRVSHVDVWSSGTEFDAPPDGPPVMTLEVFSSGAFGIRAAEFGQFVAARARKRIEVAAAAPSGDWGLIHTADAGATTFQDQSVLPGTTYEYFAVHLQGAEEGAPSNVAEATALGDPPAAAAIYEVGRFRLNLDADGRRLTNAHEIVSQPHPQNASKLQYGFRCRVEKLTSLDVSINWRDSTTGGQTGGYGFELTTTALAPQPDGEGFDTHFFSPQIDPSVDDVLIFLRARPSDPPVRLRWRA